MSRVVRHRQTQVGGACTPSERDELDQYLLDQTPRDALKALNDLQVTRRGNYEYILAIGRLYRQFQWMQAHGFPPEPSNVLWWVSLRSADRRTLGQDVELLYHGGKVTDIAIGLMSKAKLTRWG